MQKDERMIYMKDMLFAVVHQWKLLLVIALAAAVLLGAAKGISGVALLADDAAVSASKTQYQQSVEQYGTKKESIERKISDLQSSIVLHEEYLDNSPLMQLNPYDHYEVALSIYVQTDYKIIIGSIYQDPDATDAVIGAYTDMVFGAESLQALAEAAGTQQQYMPELLSVESIADQNTLRVMVLTNSAESAQKLQQALAQQLTGARATIEATVADHSAKIVDQTITKRVDLSLHETRQKEQTRLENLIKSLESAQSDLKNIPVPAFAHITSTGVVKDAVKTAILGAVAGVFAAAFAIVIAHILSQRVYSDRTLRNRTGLKVLGCINCRKYCTVLDRKIDKLEGRSVADTDMQLALLGVDLRCRADGIKTLLITGSISQTCRQQVVAVLREAMPDVQVLDCGNLTETPAALETLKVSDGVVLVEKCGISNYRSVKRLTEIIMDYEKQILGCVLLNG